MCCFLFSGIIFILQFEMQRPPKVSIGPPHPDAIVETSSLSAVQPPEPTYDLQTKDNLESSKALSCLQIETLIYACQVGYLTYVWTSNHSMLDLHYFCFTETHATSWKWQQGWIFSWRWSWCWQRTYNCRVNLGELAPWEEKSIVRSWLVFAYVWCCLNDLWMISSMLYSSLW